MTRELNACPFPEGDPDRAAIWDMLVRRDIDAFVSGDWSLVAGDFADDVFFGIDAKKDAQVDKWSPGFASLAAYRDEWLRQAHETARNCERERLRKSLLALTDLTHIDITDDFAVAHKKFNGVVELDNGSVETLQWQTLYLCRKTNEGWKITGFIGYMPYSATGDEGHRAALRRPATEQHVTAGPYSPVVEVMPGSRLIAISGQAPLDISGAVVGETIEQQARVTLQNCRIQLNAAGVDFADVFSVRVYMRDLAEWDQFNAIYREIMPSPFPARTAIQTGLLPGFLVEIDMMAAAR